jgi:hypothetical protein
MMWWRVEFTGEGGIKSCDQVEATQKGKGRVCFVQASSKAEACDRAKVWHSAILKAKREYNSTRRAKLKAQGVCTACAMRPARPNRKTCAECGKRLAETSKRTHERSQGKEVPFLVPAPPTDSKEARARFEASQTAFRLKEKAAGRRCSLYAHTILAEFDARGPEAFRAWLVEKIEASKTS